MHNNLLLLWVEVNQMGREIQDDNDDAVVKVGSGVHRDTGETTSDFIVADKQAGEHHHIVITEDGEEVHHGVKDD
jgi:hypothetical protein